VGTKKAAPIKISKNLKKIRFLRYALVGNEVIAFESSPSNQR
jgi:hypothetical protein